MSDEGSETYCFFTKTKRVSQRFTGPGRMAQTPRAAAGDSTFRSERCPYSMMLNRHGNLSMCATFLIRLLPPPHNRGQQPQRASFLVVGRAASGGVLAPEPPRATRSQPASRGARRRSALARSCRAPSVAARPLDWTRVMHSDSLAANKTPWRPSSPNTIHYKFNCY